MYEKKALMLHWGGGSCTVPLYDMNVLAAEDNNGVTEWTASVTEADLVYALMSRYPGFHEYIASFGDIAAEEERIHKEYSTRADELKQWKDERIGRIEKRFADIKKLNILMGDLPKDKQYEHKHS